MTDKNNQLLSHITSRSLRRQIGIGIVALGVIALKLRNAESFSWLHFVGGFTSFIIFPIYKYMVERPEHWPQFTNILQQIDFLMGPIVFTGYVGLISSYIWLFPNSAVLYYNFFLGVFIAYIIVPLYILRVRSLYEEK